MIDCGVPISANQVIIDSFNNTKFGDLITFHCEESNNSMTAVCGSDVEWVPNPASLVCGESGNTPSGIGMCDMLYLALSCRYVLLS